MNQPAARRDDEYGKPEGDRTENTAGSQSLRSRRPKA